MMETTDAGGAKKRSALPLILAAVSTAALLALIVYTTFFSRPLYSELLVRSANETNLGCPYMVDEYTRLNNAIVLTGDTLQYNYTLVNADRNYVNAQEFEAKLKPVITKKIRENTGIQELRNKRITFAYLYKDGRGQFVSRIVIGADVYGQ